MGSLRTPDFRRLSMLGFDLAGGGHSFYALLDFDITELRARLREGRREGTGGSLLAFMLKAIAASLTEHPECNAIMDWRRTTRFEGVDIALPVEVEREGKPVNKQLVIRDVASKPIGLVSAEIEASKKAGDEPGGQVFPPFVAGLLARLPRALSLALLRPVLLDHERVRRYSGTVFVTSVSMVSTAPGYVIPYIGGPKAASFAIGSVSKKPVVRRGAVEIREMINVTAVFNHDIVDGAPAARCVNSLRRHVETDFEALLA